MPTTTPNKESVRRVTKLNGATFCYILVEPHETNILMCTDIPKSKHVAVIQELKDWCGMPFEIYAADNNDDIKHRIIKDGEKILPIEM